MRFIFEDEVIVFIERIHDKNRNKLKYDSGLCSEGVPVAARVGTMSMLKVEKMEPN